MSVQCPSVACCRRGRQLTLEADTKLLRPRELILTGIEVSQGVGKVIEGLDKMGGVPSVEFSKLRVKSGEIIYAKDWRRTEANSALFTPVTV